MFTLAAKRSVLRYFSLAILVMILGLCARRISIFLPHWINMYLGDILWGLMVFLVCGFLFRNSKTRVVSATAIVFSFAIEISQLYHSPWIDSLRKTKLGGLVLGYGFLWSDLVSYAVGIGIGILIEKAMTQSGKGRENKDI